MVKDMIQRLAEKKRTLQEAFDELRSRGFLTLPNHLCCNTCFISDVSGYRENPRNQYTGYVGYHAQSEENLVETGIFYLLYGSFEDSEEEDAARGREIVEVLQKHGIFVNWSGEARHKIGVNLN